MSSYAQDYAQRPTENISHPELSVLSAATPAIPTPAPPDASQVERQDAACAAPAASKPHPSSASPQDNKTYSAKTSPAFRNALLSPIDTEGLPLAGAMNLSTSAARSNNDMHAPCVAFGESALNSALLEGESGGSDGRRGRSNPDRSGGASKWSCEKCGCQNYARKMSCSKCFLDKEGPSTGPRATSPASFATANNLAAEAGAVLNSASSGTEHQAPDDVTPSKSQKRLRLTYQSKRKATADIAPFNTQKRAKKNPGTNGKAPEDAALAKPRQRVKKNHRSKGKAPEDGAPATSRKRVKMACLLCRKWREPCTGGSPCPVCVHHGYHCEYAPASLQLLPRKLFETKAILSKAQAACDFSSGDEETDALSNGEEEIGTSSTDDGNSSHSDAYESSPGTSAAGEDLHAAQLQEDASLASDQRYAPDPKVTTKIDETFKTPEELKVERQQALEDRGRLNAADIPSLVPEMYAGAPRAENPFKRLEARDWPADFTNLASIVDVEGGTMAGSPVAGFPPEVAEQYKEAFMKYPKDWNRIAAALPNHNVADCIWFYRQNKRALGVKSRPGKRTKVGSYRKAALVYHDRTRSERSKLYFDLDLDLAQLQYYRPWHQQAQSARDQYWLPRDATYQFLRLPADGKYNFRAIVAQFSQQIDKEESEASGESKLAKWYQRFFEETMKIISQAQQKQARGTTRTQTKKLARGQAANLKQEESFHNRPSIKLVLSDHLKGFLVDDWENVTKNNHIVELPHKKATVEKILQNYIDFEKQQRTEGSTERDILEETTEGIREYFDKALPRILLYKFEREQWKDISADWEKEPNTNQRPSCIYGAEHLCRLLVSLPELIAQTNMDAQSISRLREELAKFTNWLSKNYSDYFLDEYISPGAEYLEKARA